MYCDPQNKLYPIFVSILKHAQEANKLFKIKSINKTKLFFDPSQLIKSIANMQVLPKIEIGHLDPNSNLEEFFFIKIYS